MSGVIDTSVFTEEVLDSLALRARADEEEQERWCYHCHQNTLPALASRCKNCKNAIYCNRACRRAGRPMHKQACGLRIHMSTRVRDVRGAVIPCQLPRWYLERVLHVHDHTHAHFPGAALVFTHRESEIASAVPGFKQNIVDTEEAWPRSAWSDAGLTEDEKDSNRNMFLGVVPCKTLVIAMLARYPSVAMCVAANSVYSADTMSMLMFFRGTQWQFASVKFDWGAHGRVKHAVGFNYASDVHK